MISLLLAATMVVVIDPPAPKSCELPGLRIVLADGNVIYALSADYMLPPALGIVIVPLPDQVFCHGFERPAP
jgi:hypothetical protein